MPFSVTKIGTPPVISQALRTPMPSAGGKYSQPVRVVSVPLGQRPRRPSGPMKVRV